MITRWRSKYNLIYFRKQNQTNPDIKSDIKPRDARWIDPTPKTHPELVKIKSRPQTAQVEVPREPVILGMMIDLRNRYES